MFFVYFNKTTLRPSLSPTSNLSHVLFTRANDMHLFQLCLYLLYFTAYFVCYFGTESSLRF